jgi:threonyl-tRNA synthetase
MNTFAGEGNWRVNAGDGAFYGPKIDIKVSDSMDRIHQCATIQLDFQLPIRFDLKYKSNVQVAEGEEGEEGGEVKPAEGEKPKKEKFDKKAAKAAKKAANAAKEEGGALAKKEEKKEVKTEFVVPDAIPKAGFERPVMVHRAMLGSVERMFAVLCEHYGGKWPFWLSPRQVMLVPVHADQFEYGEMIRQKLHAAGVYAENDTSKNTFPKKVRNAQVEAFNYQLVIGKEELANGTVNVRTRANEVKGEMKVDDFVAMCVELMQNKDTRE